MLKKILLSIFTILIPLSASGETSFSFKIKPGKSYSKNVILKYGVYKIELKIVPLDKYEYQNSFIDTGSKSIISSDKGKGEIGGTLVSYSELALGGKYQIKAKLKGASMNYKV